MHSLNANGLHDQFLRFGRLSLAFRSMLVSLLLMFGVRAFAAPANYEIELRWRVVDMGKNANGGDFTKANLILHNTGKNPIPAHGWALYFTSVAGVDTSFVATNSSTERLVGTLFRLTPNIAGQEIGTGESVVFELMHPEQLRRPDKAPQGPYLAFEGPSGRSDLFRIANYRVETKLPELLARQHEVSPETIYERNSAIVDLPSSELPLVFPTPLNLHDSGTVVRIKGRPRVVSAPVLKSEARLAEAIFSDLSASPRSDAPATTLTLRLAAIPNRPEPEAYHLSVDPGGNILIEGNSRAAVFHGVNTLRQLVSMNAAVDGTVEIRAVEVVDAPRFPFRGLLVDVARNFQGKEALYRLIDLMSRFRLNKLHLHLSDDEGWRLQIDGLPELTRVGGRRAHGETSSEHLPPAHGSGPLDDDLHGSGYYTGADFVDILRYAADRHIEVIPEIEMPGHARAAVKAMEARSKALRERKSKGADDFLLNDPDDHSKYLSAQLHSDNVMNACMESTYRFVDHVVGELARLHRRAGVRLRTVHVGADELADGAWEGSPACHQYMDRNGLAQTADLWDHFYGRVRRILGKHGAHASGWEELGTRKVKLRGKSKLIPNPKFALGNFELFVWNNLDEAGDLAYRLANAGYKVVLAPATYLYYDMAHSTDPREPGVDWAAIVDLDKVFDFVPLDFLRRSPVDSTPIKGFDGLTDYGRENVIGLEGTLFSEVMRYPEQIEFLLLPRMLAMAERAWAADPEWAKLQNPDEARTLHTRAWSIFANTVGKVVLPRLDREVPKLNYRIPPPGLKRDGRLVRANQQLPGFVLRYATGGALPTATSPALTAPLETGDSVTVAAFNKTGRASRASTVPPL